MTRPIIKGRPFNVVCAPSKSRPQLPVKAVRDDLLQAKTLMGESGVAGFTEISHAPIKALFRSVFGRRVGLSRSDCPITWTPDCVMLDGGTEYGAAAIARVAPIRRTTWARLKRTDGLTVGVVAVHMHPGGFAAHPSRAQRLVRPLIQLRWKRQAMRIRRRVEKLVPICDVVVLMGDINHPGYTNWAHLRRETGPGLLYVGTNGDVTHSERRGQHADHPAAVVTIAPRH